MTIYFIQAGNDGLVKIGHSTNARRRFATLQTTSAVPLHLRRLFQGGRREEIRLHRRFDAKHVYGEWFEPCEAMFSETFGMIEVGLDLALPPPRVAVDLAKIMRNAWPRLSARRASIAASVSRRTAESWLTARCAPSGPMLLRMAQNDPDFRRAFFDACASAGDGPLLDGER